MQKNLEIIRTLELENFTKIDIEEILNYLETLEYQLENTCYIGSILSSNERLAKYFFLRDHLRFNIDSLDEFSHVKEILDQCIDWSEFWRLLVIKKGFCCIKLSRQLTKRRCYVFLAGSNILSGPCADISYSIHDDDD